MKTRRLARATRWGVLMCLLALMCASWLWAKVPKKPRPVKVVGVATDADAAVAKEQAIKSAAELAIGFYLDESLRSDYEELIQEELLGQAVEYLKDMKTKKKQQKAAGSSAAGEGEGEKEGEAAKEFVVTVRAKADLPKIADDVLALADKKPASDARIMVAIGEKDVAWDESDGAAEAAVALYLVRAGYKVIDRRIYNGLVVHDAERFAALVAGEEGGLELARTCWADVLVLGEVSTDPPREVPGDKKKKKEETPSGPGQCDASLTVQVVDAKTGTEVDSKEFSAHAEGESPAEARSAALRACLEQTPALLQDACARATPEYHAVPVAMVPAPTTGTPQPALAVFDLQIAPEVVDEYRDPSEYRDLSNRIGPGVADLLLTELVPAGRFRVLDRSILKQVSNVLGGSRQGLMEAPYIGAEAGKVVAADLALIGTVTRFRQRRHKGAGIPVPFVGAIRLSKQTANAALELRVVEVETGRVLWAGKAADKKEEKGYGFSLAYMPVFFQDFDFNKLSFGETLVGKATLDATKEIVGKLLAAFPLTGQVLAVTDDGVVVSLGRSAGLAEGTELIVFRPQQRTGKFYYGSYERGGCQLCGTLRVVDLQEDACQAQIVDGTGNIREGDCVQPKAPPPSEPDEEQPEE